jgi:Mg-chelatase subunit ChlD
MCMLLACGGAVSQQRELKTDQNEKVDAILLLDGSGSMRITDPLKLRDEGARLFSQFLKAGDRLGVIGFSTDAQVIRPLSDYDSSQGAAIGADIARVGDSGLHTDLLTGIRAGKSMMDQQGRKDARKVIILLSDGKMEPDPARTSAAAATEQLLKEVLPELKSSEVKIHTLSFSDKADKELLAEIAAGTEGTSMYTPDADTGQQ